AVEVPPSWPENHMSSSDLTLPRNGRSTGLVVLSTTTVFGFRAATALTRLIWAGEIELTAEIVAGLAPLGLAIVDDPPGSLKTALVSLRNTTAIRLPAAAA